jgi:hypothetical protein
MADDVLKVLVDDALERGDLHPDRRTVLQEWREDNTSDEEKEAALTDEEREAKRQEEGKESPATSERAQDDTPDVTTETKTDTRIRKGR